ncbi:scavenger receptor cysteine-rich type 1 protein M130-like isoform X3 [Chrysemys picta bellii]|uniref:scavenger receptor cysteine-rich type 1 protein M130-like isoform X3 n=1 Tax=Chrysemys picta bellii TaxID=8478 RepID=UPI0032B2635B
MGGQQVRLAMKGHLSTPVLWLLLLTIQDVAGADELRLVNGGSPCAGRVEVKHQDQWGTVCDFIWDMEDAEVVCKQLGCGSAVSALGRAHFGAGSGPTWLYQIDCGGDESALWDCSHRGWGARQCSHSYDTGVICSGHIKPRLVGGDGACSGRVEIKHENTWTTVCDAHLDLKVANVICNELECGIAVSIPGGGHFGEGQGKILTEEFQCVGNESLLFSCSRKSHVNQTCSHINDAGVICSRFRMVNGSSECSGRVEFQVLGTWGTLCDSRWDLADANVLCHQLDCGFAVSAPGGGFFGKGNDSVWPDTFHCNGNEPHLWHCPVTALGASQCSHDNDASVVCSGHPESLRLLNGESQCDGRVEISLHGVWSRVLDDQWDMNDASVVCRQLQCGVAEKAYNPPTSERGTGLVGLRSVQCAGNETNLMLCIISTSEAEQPGIAEDVGVVCSEFTDLRLVSGSDCAGRLEVFYSGTWGSVCDSPMDSVTMAFICKHLDCGDRGTLLKEFTHGRGSGPTWVDGVRCDKQHSSLWQCPSDPWKQQSCNRVEETHIACEGRKGKPPQTLFTECPNSTSCTDQEKLRVVGGEDGCSGRVEVWYRGSWGTVCDDSWDMADANVVCKQLGCGSAVSAPGEAAFGEGSGPIWVEMLNCRGTESSLWDCCSKPWGESNCDHKEDAAVNCSGLTERTDSLNTPV